jgi:hypothetical protein
MGWKNLKEHYRIEHLVQVSPEGICIGSPYIHNIIVVGLDGVIKKRDRSSSNEDLSRYMREMDADLDRLRQLVQAPDKFGDSTTVFTYDGGEILEKLCETPGWPNVTHDGALMYENTYSSDKGKVVEWAKRNADGEMKFAREHVVEAELNLAKCRARLTVAESDRAKLEAAFPVQIAPR